MIYDIYGLYSFIYIFINYINGLFFHQVKTNHLLGERKTAFWKHFWTTKKKNFQKLQKKFLSGLPHFFFKKTLKNRTFSNFQWERGWDNFWILGPKKTLFIFVPLGIFFETSKNHFYDTKQKVDFDVFFAILLQKKGANRYKLGDISCFKLSTFN